MSRSPKATFSLQSGSLWKRVIEQTQHAIQCGALLSIPTECEFVEQEGIRFLVRMVSNLVRKDENQRKQDEKASKDKDLNPFLPYEADLFVADLSSTHLCLLNKFNVVDHHLLIITRAFEEQEDWLNLRDFEAMWQCLAEVDGLVFYNGGKVAGASQRHKHLQLVPLPLTSDGVRVPIEVLFDRAELQDAAGVIPGLPFHHAFIRFDHAGFDHLLTKAPLDAAAATLGCYHSLLRAVGLLAEEIGTLQTGTQQTAPYNLLVTREWMLVVPRSQESFKTISINSLGFAGALLVRNPEQLEILKHCELLTVLQNVALAIAR